MSDIIRNALIAALESDDVELLNPVTDETQTEIQEALDEVADASDEVAKAEEVVEVLEEAAVATESMLAAMESMIADGGMTEQTAQMQRVALEAIMTRLPISADEYSVSVESFGAYGDRLVASQESLQKVKDFLMKLWTGMKNAVIKAWTAVKNWFQTIGKGVGALKRGAAILKKRASETKGEAKDKMDAGAFVARLHVDGKFNPAQVTSGLANVASILDAALSTKNKVADAYVAAAEKGTGEVALSSAISAGLGAPIPGGKKVDHSGEDGSLKLVDSDKSAPTEQEYAVPSLSTATKIADSVTAIANAIEKYSKSASEAEKRIDKAAAAAKKKISGAKEDDADSAKAAKEAIAVTQKASRVLLSGLTSLPSYAASTAKVGLAFGHKICAQYGKEK